MKKLKKMTNFVNDLKNNRTVKRVMFGIFVLTVGTVAGCTALDEVSNNKNYQKAKQMVNSGVDYVGEKTTELINSNETTKKWADEAGKMKDKALSGVKAEANKLFEKGKEKVNEELGKVKENVKNQVKEKVSEKIDKTFDNM